MRVCATFAGLALALALPAAAAHAEDPKTTTDVRCVVVGGSLAAGDDPEMQNLGRASLIYFMGRLEGRGDVANLTDRIVEEETRMTSDDVKTQSKVCGALFSSTMETLQGLSDAIQKRVGAAPAPKPQP